MKTTVMQQLILETLAERVHNAWWNEKLDQGFHSPKDCPHIHDYKYFTYDKFEKICDKCHPDMYPYEELPENIKDYDRVTVKTVLKAIGEITND